jgi:methionyl-tRNA synthetase
MSAGLAPPKRVYAHGWWTKEGQKISKSVGNVIDPYDIVEHYGLDQVRYFLLREVPFGNDGDFSHRAVLQRINTELANDFGNLAQRVLSMIHKNCGGQIPEPGELMPSDEALLAAADGLAARVRSELAVQGFQRALDAIWSVVAAANRYVDDQAPWVLRKSDPARMATVLYVLAETIRHLAVLTQPFTPNGSARLLDQMGQAADARDVAALGQRLEPGRAIEKPQGVFPRYTEAETEAG